jgi:hypothetical protein
MNNKMKRRICLWIFGIGIVNFVLFWLVAVYLGGDAVNGKVVAGHYYLMSHGRYTEVSEAIFAYSRWHVYSTWITHPLALVAGYWYYRLKDEKDIPA